VDFSRPKLLVRLRRPDHAPSTIGRLAFRLGSYDERVVAPPASDVDRPLSALPSPAARALAFVAILAGGFAGGLIGYTLVELQCDGNCDVALGVGALIGALVTAGGMAVVAVLVLRALGEWRQLNDRERRAAERPT
jgi:hypothetical protein